MVGIRCLALDTVYSQPTFQAGVYGALIISLVIVLLVFKSWGNGVDIHTTGL